MAFRPNRSEGGDDKRNDRREGGFNSEKRNTGKPFERGGREERKPYGNRPDGGSRPAGGPRREDGDRPRFNNDRGGERRNFNNDRGGEDRPYRRDDNREGQRPFRRVEGNDRRPSGQDRGGDRPAFRRDDDRGGFRGGDRNERPGGNRPSGNNRYGGRGNDRPYGERGSDRPEGGSRFDRRDGGERPYGDRGGDRREGGNRFDSRGGERRDRDGRLEGRGNDRRDAGNRYGGPRRDDRDRPAGDRDNRGGYGKRDGQGTGGDRRRSNDGPPERRGRGGYGEGPRQQQPPRYRSDNDNDRGGSRKAKPEESSSELMTLNKYLAHSGVSSRREAGDIVKEGKVTVNGEVVTTPGYRVQPGDVVAMDGKTLKPEAHHVYILLNKPKDFLTTTEDDRGRRTVLDLVDSAGVGRLYPIGRLDRDTTGVILLTNDGDLAQKLSHPKYEVKKVYQVTLDKDVTKKDFDAIITGVELEDGVAVVDELAYLENKNEIGLQIHSGRNRIVRRIFEHLGYAVEKLDRVMYAGLTKKNVSRGKWRFLTEREVVLLKHFKNQ